MMIRKVLLLSFLLGTSEGLPVMSHQQLLSSWCAFHGAGVVYSHGEYFFCQKEFSATLPKNLKGVNLKIGIVEGGDFEYDCSLTLRNGKYEFKDSYSKFVLSILQEILQFEVTFVGSTSWGYYEQNQTWKGLAGLMAAKGIDMSACHWSATEHLIDVADFLFSTLETTQSFVYLPQNLPLLEDVFVEAFSRKLWIFFLLSIILLVVSFWFSTQMHSRVRPDHEPWGWDEVVLWAVAAVSQQSYSRHPRGSSCRTMFLIGYMITYLLYTGFAAGITSLLALQDRQNRLTLDDVAQMKLHLILHRDEYYLDLFEKSRLQLAYLNLEGDNLSEIFTNIQRPNFLGIGSTVSLLHYLREKIDRESRQNFVIVPVPHSVSRKAFLVKQKFPYKKLFNYWLLRLMESGFLNLAKKRYLKTSEASNFKVTKWFSVGLGNVFSAVAFLFFGWFLSASVLLLEILRKGKSNQTAKKVS